MPAEPSAAPAPQPAVAATAAGLVYPAASAAPAAIVITSAPAPAACSTAAQTAGPPLETTQPSFLAAAAVPTAAGSGPTRVDAFGNTLPVGVRYVDLGLLTTTPFYTAVIGPHQQSRSTATLGEALELAAAWQEKLRCPEAQLVHNLRDPLIRPEAQTPAIARKRRRADDKALRQMGL